MTVHLIVSLNCSAENKNELDFLRRETKRIADEALDREKRQIEVAD